MPELSNLSIDSESLGRANPQSACPFYRIPREIRDQIFELAVTRYEDFNAPFDMTYVRQVSQYRHTMRDEGWPRYRIGHQHRLRTCVALLETCKRIYRETHLLSVSVNEHCLRYLPSEARHVLDKYDTKADLPLIGRKYFGRMTSTQLAAVRKVHIFANRDLLAAMDPGTYGSDTAWAELGFMRCAGGQGYRPTPAELEPKVSWNLKGPFPQEFTVTIGHNDWCRLPGDEIFGLTNMLHNLHWENVLGGVKVFKMELEKMTAHKAPLENLHQAAFVY